MEVFTLLMLFLSFSCGQDVADCSWKKTSEKSELNCHLKTLQTGPAVIPQVRYHFCNKFDPDHRPGPDNSLIQTISLSITSKLLLSDSEQE